MKSLKSLIGIGAVLPTIGYGAATLTISDPDPACFTLFAGQHIDAGSVCYEVENTDLKVTYATTGGWELIETHLWVGEDQDGYPGSSNPQIGNFPYTDEYHDAPQTSFSYTVSLTDVQNTIDLANLESHCGQNLTLYGMAHAKLQLLLENGSYQTETGWGDGEETDGGSWATRSVFQLSVVCDSVPPPPPVGTGQETAIMYGNIALSDMTGCDTKKSIQRWGWQEGPINLGVITRPIWAAAGQNDLSKGTQIGNVTISVVEGQVGVTPEIFPGFVPNDVHIYVGTEQVCSANFGKTWNSSSPVAIDTSAGVFVGVHFSVIGSCQPNGNFCE